MAVTSPHQPSAAPSSPERKSARTPERIPERLARREPHERFHIPPERWPSGLKPEWKAVTIMGMANRDMMIEYYRAGWQPARAEQFPEFSGYGLELGHGQIPMGFSPEGKQIYLDNVNASDPIIIRGQMLMLRPIEMCEEADQNRQKAANEQVEQQIARLSGQSKREIGANRTTVQKKFVGKVDED